jgi:hypothetical protein
LVGLVGAVIALSDAPRSDAAPPRKGWVGSVPETAAVVGVVAQADHVTAYVCDGRRIGRWYSGRLRGAGARLRDRRGRTMETIQGRVQGEQNYGPGGAPA